ncbi:hypothetical protein [Streptomyces sp. NPDC005385]|uniref:hypothetical protein n=1 Tax=Streptomyces sp. NPDC005385 TaxID=3157039 RepID=UPI0033AE0CBA
MDYDVTDFEGVVLDDSYLDSVPSVVLGVEALEADVCVLAAPDVYRYDVNNACTWCGEADEAAPVRVGDTWTTSLHAGCAAGIRKASKAGSLTSA